MCTDFVYLVVFGNSSNAIQEVIDTFTVVVVVERLCQEVADASAFAQLLAEFVGGLLEKAASDHL